MSDTKDLFIVQDGRNGHVIGPYTKEGADKTAFDLNDFVQRNAGDTSKPFSVMPAKERTRG